MCQIIQKLGNIVITIKNLLLSVHENQVQMDVNGFMSNDKNKTIQIVIE